MSKAAVIFWSQTGNTEQMANAIADGIREGGMEVDSLKSHFRNSVYGMRY